LGFMDGIEAEPRVEDLVASTQFAKKLDLYAVAERLVGLEYESESFTGPIYRIKRPEDGKSLFQKRASGEGV